MKKLIVEILVKGAILIVCCGLLFVMLKDDKELKSLTQGKSIVASEETSDSPTETNSRHSVSIRYVNEKIEKALSDAEDNTYNENTIQMIVDGKTIEFPIVAKDMCKTLGVNSDDSYISGFNTTLEKDSGYTGENGYKLQYGIVNNSDSEKMVKDCLVQSLTAAKLDTEETDGVALDRAVGAYDIVLDNHLEGVEKCDIQMGDSLDSIIDGLGRQGYDFYSAQGTDLISSNVYTDSTYNYIKNTIRYNNNTKSNWIVDVEYYAVTEDSLSIELYGECKYAPDELKNSHNKEIRKMQLELSGTVTDGLKTMSIKYTPINKDTISHVGSMT